MPDLQTKPLSPGTWQAFADLVERHGGIWGGCWCMGFHPGPHSYPSLEAKKEEKRLRVCDGRAHACLVFDGDLAVGWCQFGPSQELCPEHKFKRKYLPDLEGEPDWKITCFFVDRKYRGKGVSSLALDGALEMIAKAGGGLVEAYPENMENRSVDGRFVYLGVETMFEKRGFVRQRQVAKHHWVMTKNVAAI